MYTTRRNYGINPRTIGGFIEDAFQNGVSRFNEEVSAYAAPVNIKETDNSYEVHVVAPGLKKEDFKLSVDRGLLNISYEHKEEVKEEGKEQTTNKWVRNEYRTRSFKRTFTVTDKIDTASISAKYTDGILVVNLPKKEVNEPAAKEITID